MAFDEDALPANTATSPTLPFSEAPPPTTRTPGSPLASPWSRGSHWTL